MKDTGKMSEGFDIVRVCGSTDPLYSGVERIWRDSFPECERRDDASQRAAVDGDPRFVCNAVVGRPSGRVIGVFSWWMLGTLVYGEHFAMDSSVRGHGLGAQVFKTVVSEVSAPGLPFVFEVERPDPEVPLTVRRVAFYRRLGMHLLDFPYFQPAYHPGDEPVPMFLMSSDAGTDPCAAAETIRTAYPAFL